MTAFSSGLKVLMISAKGTEEKERGQGREKGTSVKVCRDKKGQQGVQWQVISSLPAVGLQVSLLLAVLNFSREKWDACLDSKWEVEAWSENTFIL